MSDVSKIAEDLRSRGYKLPNAHVYIDCYGDTAELSEELLGLIGKGTKRAGTSLLWEHEAQNEPLPAVGDIAIVLSFSEEPRFVTRNVSVEVVSYDAVSPEYAAIEGEGDKTLEYWREAHWSYFSRVCADLGREPSPNMPLVCTIFEVLYEIHS
ncbi:MAG: ASCH domain-containing protein [Pseudomonadota bacterium]